MPSIARIRLTNLVFENGTKRFIDEIFEFEGNNGIILLENGGGKTVLLQAVLQAVLPHVSLAERRARDTFTLENGAAHIAIEWILNERPRRSALTAVTLWNGKDGLESHKYTYEYGADDPDSLPYLPFTHTNAEGRKRPASRDEMHDYYLRMAKENLNAHVFDQINKYQAYIEENLKIVISEWRSINRINGTEGGVEKFFEDCRTTAQLVDNLLIPTVEEVLAGRGSLDFARTFEEQREHFKKHQILQEQIRMNRLVQTEVDQYAEQFSVYDRIEQDLLQLKQEVRALFELATQQKGQNETALSENSRALTENEKEYTEWQRQDASLSLAVQKGMVDSYLAVLDKVQAERDRLQEMFNQADTDCWNLKIAQLKAKISEYNNRIIHFSEQLAALDRDQDVLELEASLQLNSSQLKYCFLQEEAALATQKSKTRQRLDETDAVLDKVGQQLETKQHLHNQLFERNGRCMTRIEIAEHNMQEIVRSLLSNFQHDSLQDEKLKWEKRLEYLEHFRMDNEDRLRHIGEEKQQLTSVIPDLQLTLDGHRAHLTQLEARLSRIDEEQVILLERLKGMVSDLCQTESVYLKETALAHRLEAVVEKARSQREELLARERHIRRLSDIYGGSTYFAADPQLEKWMADWQKQFSYLEAGTTYVQKAASDRDQKAEDFYAHYPFWSISIVCPENEPDQLVRKLSSRMDELTHPVYVITLSEARALLDGPPDLPAENFAAARQVFPITWQTNLNRDNFANWQENILNNGIQATRDRQAKDAELSRFQVLQTDLLSFLKANPFDQYRQLQSEIKEYQWTVFQAAQELSLKDQRRTTLEYECAKIQRDLAEISDEKHSLENRIRKSIEYFQHKTDREKAERDKQECEKQMDSNNAEIEQLTDAIKRAREQRYSQDSTLQRIEQELQTLSRNPIFIEVAGENPMETSIEKAVLELHRIGYKDQLNQKHKDRSQIQTQLDYAREYLREREKELLDQRDQTDVEIDETLNFPPRGEDILSQLNADLKSMKPHLKKLNDAVNKAKRDYDKQDGIMTAMENSFYQRYTEAAVFLIPLPEAEARLKVQQDELTLRQQYLSQQENQLQNEKSDICQAYEELRISNAQFSFMNDSVTTADLPEHIEKDFPYQRAKIVTDYNQQLQDLQKSTDTAWMQVKKQRESFRIFCGDQISDVKLRQVVERGIDERITYKEMLHWQTKLGEMIANTIRIAEDDIRELDREMQIFIDLLYTYIRNMADELRLIPKKTRVKTETGTKDVYIFDVPELDEKDGKEALRHHVDWIITELSKSRYRDEQGKENYPLIRSDIEKWLRSQQLLNIVTRQKPIKVKCRKVSNDGQISSQPSSWEFSNQWSGGEKWSKNMALFLGLLNYTAEKRQAIISKTDKSRVVILDNPFGKASSEHVLEPVFAIAEQLGFQIIALTALAEGKFVRDYFPVIYSCRLRPLANTDKYIVSSDKDIRYAFFKDHNPETIRRIGVREAE